MEQIEAIKTVCSRRGCSKRIQELERRLKNGVNDSWFQQFWIEARVRQPPRDTHVCRNSVATLWHTGNMPECPDS
eukprot:5686912-Prymnesium_polylepis.1